MHFRIDSSITWLAVHIVVSSRTDLTRPMTTLIFDDVFKELFQTKKWTKGSSHSEEQLATIKKIGLRVHRTVSPKNWSKSHPGDDGCDWLNTGTRLGGQTGILRVFAQIECLAFDPNGFTFFAEKPTSADWSIKAQEEIVDTLLMKNVVPQLSVLHGNGWFDCLPGFKKATSLMSLCVPVIRNFPNQLSPHSNGINSFAAAFEVNAIALGIFLPQKEGRSK